MAVLGSLLFNRTLKQFLDCQDLSSAKGVELVAKLREATRGSLGKILEAIPSTQNPHKDILASQDLWVFVESLERTPMLDPNDFSENVNVYQSELRLALP
jgi:hypothetical protein